MSKKKRSMPSMPSPPPETEEFLALLLWAQRGDCDCAACKYFRNMGSKMMDKHIPKGEIVEQ